MEAAVAAARAGGAVLVEGLQRPKQIELKSERSSIVTWADVTSQAAIFDVIGEHVPGPRDPRRGRHRWCRRIGPHVDRRSPRRHVELRPRAAVRVRLGGARAIRTASWSARSSSRSAASCSPRPAGVVRGSATARITAEDGGERLGVSSADSLARALVCTGLQSDDPDQIAAYGRRIVALYSTARGTRAPRFAGAVPGVRRGRPHRCLPRTRRHVRVGRRRGRRC